MLLITHRQMMARPGIDRLEQCPVCGKDVAVGQQSVVGQRRERCIKPRREGCMLQSPHDRAVLLASDIPEIASFREVAEWIEGHWLISRR